MCRTKRKEIFALIGGTGFYHPGLLKDLQEKEVNTAYGMVTFKMGDLGGKRVAFLARHGQGHHLPPHRINYRANMAALQELGVRGVLSTTAVGSLRSEIPRGMLVVIDQFIDMTKNREHTFYDGAGGEVVHTDFTEPYCPQLRKHLCQVLSRRCVSFRERGTYICTEGPRYETPAEIRAYAAWGADVVGMTNVPEVTLAREAGLCYASLSLVTNFAAGISDKQLSHREVVEGMEEQIKVIREVFMETIASLPGGKSCCCGYKEVYKLGEPGCTEQ